MSISRAFRVLMFLAVLCIFLTGCVRAQHRQAEQPTGSITFDTALDDGRLSLVTSIVSVLAAPERFDGRRVQVTGFVSIDRGHAAVVMNQESLHYDILQNGLYIQMDECRNLQEFTMRGPGKCCVLSGRINSQNHGLGGGFAATLVLTDFIETISPRGQDVGE